VFYELISTHLALKGLMINNKRKKIFHFKLNRAAVATASQQY